MQENTTKKTANIRKPMSDEQKAAAQEKRAATMAAKKSASQDAAFSFTMAAAAAIAGLLAKGSIFYARALTYHRQQGTTFPRPRNAGELARLSALSASAAKTEISEVIRQHDSRILASGNKTAQVLFDCYMANKAK